MQHYVCKLSELEERKPYFVEHDGVVIGLFLINGEVHAIENRCPHFDGPVCLGNVSNRVRYRLDENKQGVGDYQLAEYASEDEVNLVCPWHGIEFDIATGISTIDEKLRLRKFNVITKNDEVYIEM